MPDPLNMAAPGKKGKKSKGKTLSLNSFLQETPGVVPAIPLRKASSNWADEVEDSYDGYDSRGPSKTTNVVLPTAPKAARGLDDFSDKIPQNPPFKVYMSNLPFDVEDDEIAEFFGDLKIVNTRLPRDDRPSEGRPRGLGYAYVEFEDRESLIEALEKPSCTLKGRRIRVEVATNSETDGRRGRMDMNRDRADRPEAPTGDWRSGGRKEPEGPERRYRDGGGRDFNRDRNQEDRSGGMWRDGGDRPAFRDRDGGDRPSFRDRENNDRYREDKPITRDHPPQSDFGERRGGYGPRRGGDRNDDRMERSERTFDRSDRNGGYRRDNRDDDRDRAEPRTRPKLNLAKRTVPTGTDGEENKPTVEQSAKPPAASIFGNAKPVDTAAREREIEERLAKQNESDVKKDDDRVDRRRDNMRNRRSPDRRRSPERRNQSPRRSASPSRRQDSSPDGKQRSPDRRYTFSDKFKRSPDRYRRSPDRSRRSPDRRRGSPDRRRNSNERGRDDNRRRNEYNDRHSSRENRDRIDKHPAKEFGEREMPKVKSPEPLNIVGPNKYAYLENDDDD